MRLGDERTLPCNGSWAFSITGVVMGDELVVKRPDPTVLSVPTDSHIVVTEELSTALATCLTTALTNVLKSPEMGQFVETLAKGKALSGMMEALVSHDGRKGLDASTMKQNAIEISHFIDQVFDKFKTRAVEKSSGEVASDLVDNEAQGFSAWLKDQPEE